MSLPLAVVIGMAVGGVARTAGTTGRSAATS
jgi:hypothetical protein